jgi:hypothetical protein
MLARSSSAWAATRQRRNARALPPKQQSPPGRQQWGRQGRTMWGAQGARQGIGLGATVAEALGQATTINKVVWGPPWPWRKGELRSVRVYESTRGVKEKNKMKEIDKWKNKEIICEDLFNFFLHEQVICLSHVGPTGGREGSRKGLKCLIVEVSAICHTADSKAVFTCLKLQRW